MMYTTIVMWAFLAAAGKRVHIVLVGMPLNGMFSFVTASRFFDIVWWMELCITLKA
jgi:hypothetical protein